VFGAFEREETLDCTFDGPLRIDAQNLGGFDARLLEPPQLRIMFPYPERAPNAVWSCLLPASLVASARPADRSVGEFSCAYSGQCPNSSQ
jgi:hypothetical protein